jgi:hypothetical protein
LGRFRGPSLLWEAALASGVAPLRAQAVGPKHFIVGMRHC